MNSWIVPGVLLALLSSSLLLFAVTRTMPTTGSSYGGRGGTFAGTRWVRDWFYWLVGPCTRVFVGAGFGPSLFNASGLLFGLAGATAFALGDFQLAALFVIGAGISDVFDGEVARAIGVASAKGSFIDASLDRIVDGALFIGLAVYFRTWNIWVLVAVLTAGYSGQIVSYLKARGEAHSVTGFGGPIQRGERLVTLVVTGLFDPVLALAGVRVGGTVAVGTVALAVLSVMTAIGRFRHGVNALSQGERVDT